jgi:uncharacterized protein
MSKWRILVLLVLVAAPVVFLAGLGSYALWEKGWAFLAWWPLSASLALAYFLGLYWHRKRQLLYAPSFQPVEHWTERDRQAWRLVEARALAAAGLDSDKLAEFQFYVDTAQEMALELARAYHPGVSDPVGRLTVPEILTVVELASRDLTEVVDKYLPGGHLLTINQWKQARQAADWYRTASNVYWFVAALFSPIQTGVRYAASQVGMSRPWELLQQDLLVWFYTAYVHRVGNYLIELNSGRLRVGAQRYRELVRGQPPAPADGAQAASGSPPAKSVTITVMGQVKAGKSSFINALLGEQRARADVLPATDQITSYTLKAEGIPSGFVLLDTVGYGHEGPKQDQVQATQGAAEQSDLLLLVMHARNPARRADVELLQELTRRFAARPDLRMPAVLGVMTHIDLLSPAMEWSPPYNWQEPARPKERQIQEALTAVRDQLDPYLSGCVPVCTLPGKVYGVEEWFLPTVVELLDEAHAVALLRCLRAEADLGKVRKVFDQLLAAGTEAAKALWQKYSRPVERPERRETSPQP